MTKTNTHTPEIKVYEVLSPFFPDMGLDEQIENGINDWCLEADGFQIAWGRSETEVRKNGAAFLSKHGGYAHISLDPNGPFAPIPA